MSDTVSDSPESFAFSSEALKSLTFVVNKVAERIDHKVESVVAPYELTFRQYGLLVLLQSGGPQAQITISQQSGLDRTSVMRIVDVLEARGLVRRDPDPSDRRKHSVVLTDAGAELLGRTLAGVQGAEREFEAVLSDAEQAQLLSLLKRLLRLEGRDEIQLASA